MISSTTAKFLDMKNGVWATKSIFFFGPFIGVKVKADDVAVALASKYGAFGKDEPGSVDVHEAQNGLYVKLSYMDGRKYTDAQRKAIEAAITKVAK